MTEDTHQSFITCEFKSNILHFHVKYCKVYWLIRHSDLPETTCYNFITWQIKMKCVDFICCLSACLLAVCTTFSDTFFFLLLLIRDYVTINFLCITIAIRGKKTCNNSSLLFAFFPLRTLRFFITGNSNSSHPFVLTRIFGVCKCIQYMRASKHRRL